MEWQLIKSAPKDGTPFQARIPGHGDNNVIAWTDGLMDEHEQDCGGWYMADEQEPPDCWTDGVCWETNADGTKSVDPTHYVAGFIGGICCLAGKEVSSGGTTGFEPATLR